MQKDNAIVDCICNRCILSCRTCVRYAKAGRLGCTKGVGTESLPPQPSLLICISKERFDLGFKRIRRNAEFKVKSVPSGYKEVQLLSAKSLFPIHVVLVSQAKGDKPIHCAAISFSRGSLTLVKDSKYDPADTPKIKPNLLEPENESKAFLFYSKPKEGTTNAPATPSSTPALNSIRM